MSIEDHAQERRASSRDRHARGDPAGRKKSPFKQPDPGDPASEDGFAAYLAEVGQIDLLTADEEKSLARRVEQQDQSAAHAMTRANLRLVVSVARRYLGHGLPLGDLVQEGNQGLMHAVRKFDPSRGFRFSTYATWWIRQAILRGIANMSRTIRLPAYVSERVAKLERTAETIASETGRPASPEDVGEQVGLPPRQVSAALEHARPPLSIDARVAGDPQGRALAEEVPDPVGHDPADQAVKHLLGSRLDECLKSLPDRERTVLQLRYGLTGPVAMTLEQVGRVIGVTRERVRQIEHRALERLRRPAEQLGLADYLD